MENSILDRSDAKLLPDFKKLMIKPALSKNKVRPIHTVDPSQKKNREVFLLNDFKYDGFVPDTIIPNE